MVNIAIPIILHLAKGSDQWLCLARTGFFGVSPFVTVGMALTLGVLVGMFNAFLVNASPLPSFITGWPTDWLAAFIGGLLAVVAVTNNVIRELALSRGRKQN